MNLKIRATADPVIWNAANFYTEKKTRKKKMDFRGTPVSIHRNLKRAQSSVATLIRSEHIGLRSYLYRRKVPGVDNPKCPCGYPSQNVKHMIMACPQWVKGRAEVWRKAKDRSFEAMMNSSEDIGRITKWILEQGWLQQFQLSGAEEALTNERNSMRKEGGYSFV